MADQSERLGRNHLQIKLGAATAVSSLAAMAGVAYLSGETPGWVTVPGAVLAGALVARFGEPPGKRRG